MTSSRRIPLIEIYVASSHSASASFGKGEELDEKSNKKAQKGERVVKKVISLTQISLCIFFCNSIFPSGFLISSDCITASDKKSTSKKEPASVSETTI